MPALPKSRKLLRPAAASLTKLASAVCPTEAIAPPESAPPRDVSRLTVGGFLAAWAVVALRAAWMDAIEASGRATGPPVCTPVLVDGEETIFTRIEYAAPSGTLVHDLRGRCPALDALRAAFERASLVRFERQLDRLPEAGPQPNRITR